MPFSICLEPPSKLCITENRKYMRKRSSVQHYVETCGFKIRLMLHNIIQCTDIQWWHMSLHTVQSELSTKKKQVVILTVLVQPFTLNISPSTARLMQRMEFEMLVPEMRLSGCKTRKPCSLSTNQDPPSEWPSR